MPYECYPSIQTTQHGHTHTHREEPDPQYITQ